MPKATGKNSKSGADVGQPHHKPPTSLVPELYWSCQKSTCPSPGPMELAESQRTHAITLADERRGKE